MDQEEVHSTAVKGCPHLHLHLFVRGHLTLLTSDLDRSICASLALSVVKWELEGVVSACYDLVNCELNRANIIMTREII